MAHLVQGDRSESEERLLLDSGVLDGLEALGQKLDEGLPQSVTPKFEGLGDLARMERDEQDAQQLLDSAIWERLSHLADRLEPSTAIEQAQGYKNLGDIVQGDAIEPEIQLILESGLLERLESLSQTLTEQIASAQASAYEGMNEHVQLNQREPDERLLIENRVIERLEYLAQRLDEAQTHITAQSYEGLGELIAMETHNKDVRLVLESEIIDRLKTLTNQIESRTGVQNDQINSLSQNPSASTRAIERDRPDPSIADLDLVAQPESRRNREGVTAAAPGIDDRATEISRGIAERLSGAIITGDVAEAIRELARSCGEIDADYERVRATHEGRAGLESALSQLAQSVHRLDEQLGQALRRERVNAVAGAIAEWRSEQQLGQSIAQFSGIIQSLGVDVTQPSEIAHDLAQAIGQNNVETELEAALVSLSVMFEQTQAQVMARPDIQKLSQTITDLQAEQALIEAVSQFNALIESTKPTPQRSAAEVLAQSINNVWIEDERTEALTQLNEAIAQAHAPVSPTVTLADAWSVSIATRNLETELTESLELLAELLSQTPAQHRRAPEVQQLAALIDEWRAEGDLTQAIAQFSTLMQSVSEASVTAEDLADQIVQSNVEAEIAQTTARFNEAVQQAMEPLRSRPEVIEMVNAIESLQLADLESDIAQSVERLAAQIHTLGIDRQPNPQATELAQRLLDRRAEDVLNEHLAAFNDATVAVLAELRQRPELAQLVEVVQMLRSDPTLSEGATGQQIRELTQGVQKLIPESAMPTGGDRPSLTPKPKKPEVFWVPDYSTAERPDHIEARHWQEMTKSAIHPELIALNFTSLEGEAVHDRLLSEKLATMGTGQYVTAPMARLMAQYETLTEGGWWGTAGIDAKSLINLQPGQQPHLSTWGCFKGDNPRIDQDKTERKGETEFIKYENPAGTERHLYLPIVSEDMAQKIYDMHGIQPTAAERENGFWSVVANHPEIPIAITEGLKKTLASLSQGKVTLGLAGVNGLYRARDEDKQKLPERLLNDEVAIFAAPGRSFTFAFDRDSKTSTAFNVRRELVRGVERLEDIGCHCKIAKWKPADGKGLDDLIVNQGAQAYTSAIATAQPSDQEKRTYYRTEYNAISRQVKKTQHDITNDALDIEVYLRAIAKGEPKDGERFISHSDQARSLKDPAQVTAYIEQVKAAAPQYLQQQRELEAEQAQRAADRAEYETLAARVRKTPVQLSSEVVDMQVYLIAEQEGSPGDGDRLIAQSNHARTLNDKQAVSSYVEYIKTEASSYVQRVREQIERTNDRRRYEDLVAQVRQENADIPTAHINREVYLKAEAKGLNSEVILAQSDQARTLNDPAQVQDYVERIIVEAQQYQQQQQVIAAAEAQRVADRGVYVAIAQQVETELGDIPAERVDMEIYLRAGASGADRILAQSDQAIALNDPAQVQDYIERIKAEAPLYRQQQQQLEAAQAEAEARLVHEQSIYQAIAQGAREVDSTFSIETIDRFVWIAAQQFGVEPERLLAHSERVRSNPEQAQTYIQRIKVDAAQYQQQKADAAAQEAQAPMQPEPKVEKPSEQVKPVSAAIATPQKAQQRVDQTVASIKRGLRDEYDAYAKQIVEKLGNVPPEVLDMEIYLSAGRSDHAKRLIQVGDNMVALRKNSSDFEGFYCDAIARVAPAYEEIKNDPDAKLNYKMMAAIVTNTNAKLLVESRPEPTIYRKKEREDELML